MIAKIVVKTIIYNRKLNRLLLLQRCGKDSIGALSWENAGGNLEDGETPEDAVLREVREETGITDLDIKSIAYTAMLWGELPDLLLVYLCETQTDEPVISDEHNAFVWADEDRCRELLPRHIIEDFEKNGIFELLG